MKKLFTLVALLACFLGAKAEWVQDYTIEYSSYNGFPFYVMGYCPEWVNGVMTDYGAAYRYETQENLDGDGDSKWKDGESSVGSTTAQNGVVYQKVTGAGPYWHQYMIAADVPMELDGTYTVKALVKASAAVNANLQFGNWGKLVEVGVTIPAGDDFQEVEWEVTGCTNAGTGFICIQPGTSEATIEWKSLTVGHNAVVERPTIWQEWLNSDGQAFVPEEGKVNDKYMGDAETPWADATVKFNDQEKNYLICAWSKEKGENLNDDGGWDPFPATIESEEVGGKTNHYFIVHGKPATTEGDASAWDNQFWIESPKAWKSGDQLKIKFRYKASKAVTVATQCHTQNPSAYLIWHAIGDVAFTEDWQTFDGTMNIADDMAGTWSIAFQLNQNDKDAIDFYFDDLSWQSMKLDEGFFIASSNTDKGIEYDFDNAVEFVQDPNDDELIIATVGTKGKQDTWVNEVMISTVRGNTAAFKGATIKPTGTIDGLADTWLDYTEASLAKIKLPAAGVWTISIASEDKQINFFKVEGEENKEPIDVVTNASEIVVNALERDDLSDQTAQDGTVTIREEEGGTGEAWDNQFWIIANRELETGETTVVKFKYMATKAAKASTQCHGEPGAYKHYAAIGDVNFTEEWQDFEATLTVASDANGMKSIAFNLAEFKEANDYHFKDFQWYLQNDAEGKTEENLINATGESNFAWKVVGGQIITGIKEVATKKNVTTATYNLAGQRVSDSFKGIVIKDGKKFVK